MQLPTNPEYVYTKPLLTTKYFQIAYREEHKLAAVRRSIVLYQFKYTSTGVRDTTTLYTLYL